MCLLTLKTFYLFQVAFYGYAFTWCTVVQHLLLCFFTCACPLPPSPSLSLPCSDQEHREDDLISIHEKICNILSQLRSPDTHVSSEAERRERAQWRQDQQVDFEWEGCCLENEGWYTERYYRCKLIAPFYSLRCCLFILFFPSSSSPLPHLSLLPSLCRRRL